MSQSLDSLAPGDIVEIMYRQWRPADGRDESMIERWISAHVVACETGTWPLVRLKDGQVTEIRPFMTWRRVSRATRRPSARVAA